MNEEFVCAYCGMDLESQGEFHDIGSCAKYLRETKVKMRNEINVFQTRIAELEGLVRELLAEGEYLSMLNGLVDNDSDWKQLVDKANKALPEVRE